MTYNLGQSVNIPTRSVNRCGACGALVVIPAQTGIVTIQSGEWCATMRPQTCGACGRPMTLYVLDQQTSATSDAWADDVAERVTRRLIVPMRRPEPEREPEKVPIYVRLDK